MVRYILIPVVILYLVSGNASGYFEISPLVQDSYQAITSLRLASGDVLIEKLRRNEPDNLMLFWLENYTDCLSIFISEDPILYRDRKKEKKSRLYQVEQGDPLSPYFLHVQAEIHFQWAIVRLKFRDYVTSAWELKKAYTLLTQNVEIHPEFILSRRTLAVIKALIGIVPDHLRWAVKLFGMEGSVEEGISIIHEILHETTNKDFIWRKETQILYAYMIAHLEQKPAKSWEYLNSLKLQPSIDQMDCFVMANLSKRAGLNDETIKILKNRPSDPEFFPVAHLHFMEGIARLNRLEADADISLLKFINETKGQFYIKEAYQKLAWHSLIQGNLSKYQHYMNKCKSSGSAELDEDEQAWREARYGLVPDKKLLKARLLFDGGYYQRAYDTLKNVNEEQVAENHEIEFNYRMGRICHAMGKNQDALFYYDMTIKSGRHESDYFACNASLQAGSIWETMEENEKAADMYHLCLEIYPDEYRRSIHQKAQAGLNRLSAGNTK